MRFLVQRVHSAHVDIDGTTIARIGQGLLVLVGIGQADLLPGDIVHKLVDKLLGLRIFPDADGKMNRDVVAGGGEILLVSQFTLYADCRKGRRPSFHLAAAPEQALPIFEDVVRTLQTCLPGKVQTGHFGADMDVHLVNWGPVTILLDSEMFARSRRAAATD